MLHKKKINLKLYWVPAYEEIVETSKKKVPMLALKLG